MKEIKSFENINDPMTEDRSIKYDDDVRSL